MILNSQCLIQSYGCYNSIFTSLHAMQTRSSDKNSVRLSVCPSIYQSVICDKIEERSVQIFIPYERSFRLVFWEEEWLVGCDPFCLKFWVNRPPLERNRRFSTDIRSYSSSAVTPSENSSINTNGKFTTPFPMSLRSSSYVAPKPPKGAQKRKRADFCLKSHFAWRKFATKFLCVKLSTAKL